MDTKKQFFETLEALGGTKLNVNASEVRDLSNESIINKNIKLIESSFNSQIPSDYLNFIKEKGAITFNDPVKIEGLEKIPVANNENQVIVDNFFDLFDDKVSILHVLNSFQGNIPNHVLPISDGELGDLIVVDMANPNYGKVYYWHHEHEDGTEGLYLIANDFKQFLKNLSILSESDTSTDSVTITKVSNKFLDRLKKSGKI